MTEALEEEKKRLEAKKLKLKQVEKLLKEKEKKKRARRFEEIGRLAYQANIDQLDEIILMGAFLEISERKSDQKILEKWQRSAGVFMKEKEDMPQEALTITFNTDPGKEIKDQLKGMGFKWNSFRREYYGYGCKSELDTLLKSCDKEIEINT